MQTLRRISVAVASFAIAAGALVVFGSTASAIPDTAALPSRSCTYHEFQGSGGHWGADVTCTGGWFKGTIRCHRFDNGFEYWHYGPVSGSGGTSTVYCDLNAYINYKTYTEV
ncbi:hypothetical protein Acsp05_07200 [Actinokineospora sp. NBRC 105648]|nr:hypothetical protein Acsp05_07200 [Actinokineospora sp. NBRC 105648]